MKKRPKILVVGSLMMNQGIETSVTPEEVQTVIDWGKKQKIGIILEGEKYGYYDLENTDDYYIAMKNKTEADCKTTLYPLNEAVDVPKWTDRKSVV